MSPATKAVGTPPESASEKRARHERGIDRPAERVEEPFLFDRFRRRLGASAELVPGGLVCMPGDHFDRGFANRGRQRVAVRRRACEAPARLGDHFGILKPAEARE
jgi:hypothetical protein